MTDVTRAAEPDAGVQPAPLEAPQVEAVPPWPSLDAEPSTPQHWAATAEEEARFGRGQLELIWIRFVRNRAAMIGGGVVIVLYLIAAFANFISPYDADQRFDLAIYA